MDIVRLMIVGDGTRTISEWTSTSAKREAKARFWSLAIHPIVRHNNPCLDHYRNLLMCKARRR